jgi:hypothetical protein
MSRASKSNHSPSKRKARSTRNHNHRKKAGSNRKRNSTRKHDSTRKRRSHVNKRRYARKPASSTVRKLSPAVRAGIRQARSRATDAAVRRALWRLSRCCCLTIGEIRCVQEFIDDPDCGLSEDEQEAIEEALETCGEEDDD